MRLIAGETVPSRSVVEELLREGLDGQPPSRATVFRWIAEAESSGLIIRSGSTRATVYGLPCPVDIPDGVEEPAVVGPTLVEIPASDPVPDWEIDVPDFGFPRHVPTLVVPGRDPPWSSTWSPTGPIEHVEPWELLPTGPAAA